MLASFARLARNAGAGSVGWAASPRAHDAATTASQGLGARLTTRAPTVRVRAPHAPATAVQPAPELPAQTPRPGRARTPFPAQAPQAPQEEVDAMVEDLRKEVREIRDLVQELRAKVKERAGSRDGAR